MKTTGELYDLRVKYEHLKRAVECEIEAVKLKAFINRETEKTEEKLLLRFAASDSWKWPTRWAKVTAASADELDYHYGIAPKKWVGKKVVLQPWKSGSGGWILISPAVD